MTIRVLIADDHALLRELLHRVLDAESDIVVVGEAMHGRELMQKVQALQPDVVVIDISMPELNGIDAAAQVLSRHPRVRILCLSAHTAPSYVRSMLQAGASGYLDKSVASTELVTAVRVVASGRTYLSPQVASVVLESVRSPAPPGSVNDGLGGLGRREREVLQLLAEGCPTSGIADRLSISQATVDTHRRNIMRKLDLHSAVDLARYAIREGLVQP